jgi:PRTRC genetic system protein E
MLDLLSQIVQRGESFKVTYSRGDDDKVRLIVQPRLDDDTDLTDKDALTARAALQCPLVLEGSHADVAAKLAAHVGATRADRETLKDAYDSLRGATQSAAKAAAEAAKKKQDAPAKDTKAKDTRTADASTGTDDTGESTAKPADDGAQPTSLF